MTYYSVQLTKRQDSDGLIKRIVYSEMSAMSTKCILLKFSLPISRINTSSGFWALQDYFQAFFLFYVLGGYEAPLLLLQHCEVELVSGAVTTNGSRESSENYVTWTAQMAKARCGGLQFCVNFGVLFQGPNLNAIIPLFTRFIYSV